MPNRYLPLFVTLVVLSCPAAWAQSNEQMLKEFADKLETTNGRKPTRFELEDICEKLSTIIKESPANAEALRLRSVARVEVGEPQGALEDIAASLTLEPKNVKALTQNAIIKSFSDDPAGAIKAYEDAIKAGADTLLFTPIWGHSMSVWDSQPKQSSALTKLLLEKAARPQI
jgi:cytochrome c-type biogenesis protein CcmH/NrfG